MERHLADKLAECLDWINREGGTIDQAVSRYPEYATGLKSLIDTAEFLKEAATASPRPEFQSAARTRLENRISAQPNISLDQKHVTFLQSLRLKPRTHQKPIVRRFSMSWLMIIVAAASLLLGGGGVAFASTDALPGDALYPMKTVIQDVELALSNDEGDIDLLLGYMQENIDSMNELAAQERWDDIEVGLQQYQGNLDEILQTRTRLACLDAPSEEALLSRIQLELHSQSQELLQLQTRIQNQQKLQEKIQEAIQQNDQGKEYGPSDGGAPEEGGAPNGAGPGEPQGTQNQQEHQNQSGQPEDAGGTGEHGSDLGPGENGCGQQLTDENGEVLEEDAFCAEQGSGDQGEGMGSEQGGKP